jgi:hypothetical protein
MSTTSLIAFGRRETPSATEQEDLRFTWERVKATGLAAVPYQHQGDTAFDAPHAAASHGDR